VTYIQFVSWQFRRRKMISPTALSNAATGARLVKETEMPAPKMKILLVDDHPASLLALEEGPNGKRMMSDNSQFMNLIGICGITVGVR
jgi:hypothetical protein